MFARSLFIHFFALAALACAALAAEPAATLPAPAASAIAFRVDMNAPAIRKLPLPQGASWVSEGPAGQSVLKLTVTHEDAAKQNFLTIPIDLRPYRGARMSLVGKARAQDVSVPAFPYLGVKCMLHYKSPSGERWQNQSDVNGTFDWKTLAIATTIASDATDGEIVLGLQGSSGTAWFSDVQLMTMSPRAARPPLPPESAVLPPPYKGHDLLRLRGVMSPNVYREQDFADLAKWNVNVIRWQIGRDWGKERRDRDLAEYDHWLDGKLDEAAKALDSAQRYGMKLVLDLHSPPGGREPDRTFTMYLDKKYQDHFVQVWQRIATRFKGHPALWAYDLANEPMQNYPSPDGVADWLGTQLLAARAIRAIDPTTAIAIEVDAMDSPDGYTALTAVPVSNVIYQVHMYVPGEYTHQLVHNNWGEKGATKLIAYPSRMNGGIEWNKDALRRALQPVRDFQRTYNAHIYVGEFSAIRWAPGADQYLSDLIDIFEDYGWDWTYHAFREWPGWSVEHADLPADPRNHPLAATETARAKVLKKWFAKNERTTTAEK